MDSPIVDRSVYNLTDTHFDVIWTKNEYVKKFFWSFDLLVISYIAGNIIHRMETPSGV